MRSTVCERLHYGYPHEGCAEFGPPDEWPCGQPGVIVLRTTFTDVEWVRFALMESEDDVVKDAYDKMTSTITLCEECASESDSGVYGVPMLGEMPYGEELVTLEAVL